MNPQPAVQPDDTCLSCDHAMDAHEMLLVVRDDERLSLAGIVLCPAPECRCFSTWATSLTGGRNTPQEQKRARLAVRAALIEAGNLELAELIRA
jgi:hypothetical protein